jgi:predicted nucleic acid-binding protein
MRYLLASPNLLEITTVSRVPGEKRRGNAAGWGEGTLVVKKPIRKSLSHSHLVAAARSRRGASFALVRSIPHPKFEVALSVALYTEWQAVLTRPEHLPPGQSLEKALAFLRYLAGQCHWQDIFYLWRPCLKDADDDMVLELAVAARCSHILTHNLKDFRRAGSFGIVAITPGEFHRLIQTSP